MRRHNLSAIVLGCLALCLAALAAGPVFASGGKSLTMYVAYGGPGIIAREFQKDTGIEVKFLTMSSGEVLTRLRAEKGRPVTDIWFGGGSDAFIQAAKEGLIAPYVSPNAEAVSPDFKDPDGYWTGVSLVVVGFVANTKRLADKHLPVPGDWTALAAPGFKDEILASNPNTSGTAYTTVSGILQIMGEKKGWEFLKAMYSNIPFLTKSGSAPGKKALAGEFAVGIAPDPHITLMDNPKAPIKCVFPSDGVLAWPSPVAIIKGAPNLAEAKAFVDWSLSPRGQKVLMQASPRVPTTDVTPLPGVPRLKDLNLVAYDHVHWGAERERVVKQFNSMFPQFR